MFSHCQCTPHVLKILKLIFNKIVSSSFNLRKKIVKFRVRKRQFAHWRSVKRPIIDGCLKKREACEHILKVVLIEGLWLKVSCCGVAKKFIKNDF